MMIIDSGLLFCPHLKLHNSVASSSGLLCTLGQWLFCSALIRMPYYTEGHVVCYVDKQ